MCKFNKPQIPAGATADERRAIYFDALYSLAEFNLQMQQNSD